MYVNTTLTIKIYQQCYKQLNFVIYASNNSQIKIEKNKVLEFYTNKIEKLNT